MNNASRKIVCTLLAYTLAWAPAWSQSITAETSVLGVTSKTDDVRPLLSPVVQSNKAKPMIMLNMSRDHQLFYRAYTEFADLDGDGTPETTYKHANLYYGYFHPKKCYVYDNGNGRFRQQGPADSANYCSGTWSGNFLNWATMTRMDIVRKVLYGGYRSTDTRDLTVLERAQLPTDAHSFAKYYSGDDLSKLTPYSLGSDGSGITMCNTTMAAAGDWSHRTTRPPLMRVAQGNYQLWNANERWQCFWQGEDRGGATTNGNAGTPASARPLPFAEPNNPPRGSEFNVRVEVCPAGTPVGEDERCKLYGTSLKPTGLLHKYGEAGLAEFGLLTGSFSRNISGGVLRRNVSDFQDEVNAADGTFKPTSGTGGVQGIVYTLNQLRIVGYSYTNGQHYDGDEGTFCAFQTIGLTNGHCVSWGNPIGEMFLESLRYFAGASPSAAFVQPGDAADERLGLPTPRWVDPFRRGADVDAKFGKRQCRPINIVNFNASVISYDGDKAADGTRPDLASFSSLSAAPVSGAPATLEAALSQIGSSEGIVGRQWFVGSAGGSADAKRCTAKTISSLADVEGLCPDAPAYRGSFLLPGLAYWGHTNRIRSTTSMGLATGSYTGDLEEVSAFVNTFGVALSPGKPRIEAKVGDRTVVIQPSYVLCRSGDCSNKDELGYGTLVDFRVIDLAEDGSSGKFLVIWEDSEQGGDYDQDASGILEFKVTKTDGRDAIAVTTSVFADATVNPQGFGYTISGTDYDGAHFHSGIRGFNWTETNASPSITVQAPGGAPVKAPNINTSGGCQDCVVNQPATTATYTVSTTASAGQSLQDPMWYAAKWGGFRRGQGNTNTAPTAAPTWDANGDGIPDNYFQVFNPAKLEAALDNAFAGAIGDSGTPPAVSSSQLNAGSVKYEASFDLTNQPYFGDIKAYALDAVTGEFKDQESWSANDRLAAVAPAQCVVLTDNVVSTTSNGQETVTSITGANFLWSDLSASYRQALNPGIGVVRNAQDAADLVDYLRGSSARETSGAGATRFRSRAATVAGKSRRVLGPIVNSVPWIQAVPSANYAGPGFEGYGDWAKGKNTRQTLLWVAANDGMLHAFNLKRLDSTGAVLNTTLNTGLADGAPVLSFVPSVLAKRLSSVAEPDGGNQALFDGSPFTGDVKVGGSWATYLFAPLGRGARAIYALDVTSVGQGGTLTARDVFKWRFTADDDADLGHIVSDPYVDSGSRQASPIVKLNDGRFAVLFGNGYASASGKAALFILPVAGPGGPRWASGEYVKLVAESTEGDNGLSAPSWVDVDGNGTADFVYAGDLKGNLWKFDLSSATPSQWKVSLDGKALFKATDGTASTAGRALPITSAPMFASPAFGGLTILFGTGRALETADFPDPLVRNHRVFGIWDSSYRTDLTPPPYPLSVADLQRREYVRDSATGIVTVSATSADSPGADFRASNKYGWYFDLPGDATSTKKSEMVVFNPVVVSDTFLFTTIRPPLTDSETVCFDGPRGSLYFVDPVQGTPTTRVRVDAAKLTLGVVGVDTKALNGVVVTNSTKPAFRDPSCKDGDCLKKCVVGTEVAKTFLGKNTQVELCASTLNARIQWREVPGLNTLK